MSRSLGGDLRALARGIGAFFAGAPHWVAGIVAGAQAAGLSLVVVIAPALVVVAAAPSGASGATAEWGSAVSFAAKLWLLAHGAPFATQSVTFTLVPLGLTGVSAAIVAAVAQRFASRTWGSWLLATATYAAVVGLVAVVVWGEGPATAGVVARAMSVAVIVAAPAVAVGVWRAHGAEFAWVLRVPPAIRAGVRLGLGAAAGIVVVAALTSAAWAVVGRASIAEAASGLDPDAIGGTVLAVGQAMYAPDMAIWTVAWFTGHGFFVGAESLYSPSAVTTDAVPLLPILGALPQGAGGMLVWAPLVIVATAVFAWIALRARMGQGWMAVAAIATACAVVAVTIGVLVAASSGAAGPGRLGAVGAEAIPVALTAAALAGAGFALAAATSAVVRLTMPAHD